MRVRSTPASGKPCPAARRARGAGRGARARVLLLGACLLVVAGCGSQHSDEELAAFDRGPASTVGPAGQMTGEASTGGSGGAGGADAAGGTGATQMTGRATTAGAGSTASSGGASATTGAGGPGGGRAAAGTPIVIGNLCDCRGVPGQTFGRLQQSLQVWVAWKNANGGVNGRPIKLITGNAGNDPARAASLARDMVEKRGVIAFVGNALPLSLPGVVDYLQRRGIPSVGGDQTAALWNEHPLLFPHTTGIDAIFVAFARVAATASKPKIGLLYCAEADFVCGHAYRVLSGGGARKAGAEIVYSAQVSLAQPDFTAECLGARREGAQAMLLIMDAASINRIVRSCSQQGFAPSYVTGSLAVQKTLEGNKALVGLQAPVQTAPWMANDIPALRDYRAAIDRYAPDVDHTGDGVLAWAAGELFARSATAGGRSITSASILRGLYSLRNETLGGLVAPLRFVKGRPTAGSECYFVVEMSKDARWSATRGSRLVCP